MALAAFVIALLLNVYLFILVGKLREYDHLRNYFEDLSYRGLNFGVIKAVNKAMPLAQTEEERSSLKKVRNILLLQISAWIIGIILFFLKLVNDGSL